MRTRIRSDQKLPVYINNKVRLESYGVGITGIDVRLCCCHLSNGSGACCAAAAAPVGEQTCCPGTAR